VIEINQCLKRIHVFRVNSASLQLHEPVLKAPLSIMQGVAIAIKFGATKAQFDATVRLSPCNKYVTDFS